MTDSKKLGPLSLQAVHDFAQLSGDYNVVHVDPVASRRLLFGRIVAHGFHVLLLALDSWLSSAKSGPLILARLAVQFPAPLDLEQEACCIVTRDDDANVELQVCSGGATVAFISFTYVPQQAHSASSVAPGLPPREEQANLSPEDMPTASGSVPLMLDRNLANRLFPIVSAELPALQLAAILAATRAVAMRCPGLCCVCSAVELEFSGSGSCAQELEYAASHLDKRFSLATMGLSGPGVTGSVKAFLRPPPFAQESCTTLAPLVRPGEFAGQRALIIGGSRGLGEVTAKLLTLGGAEVRLSYAHGEADCRRVVEEITAAGGLAQGLRFDVLAPPERLREVLGGDFLPTHLYYYATPYFFQAAWSSFSPELFEQFCAYYVCGLLLTLDAAQGLGLTELRLFSPSSALVGNPPANMGEYAAAKCAAEALCTFLQKTRPGLRIWSDRLPRLATDQTASLLPVENLAAAPVLLDILRRMEE